MVMVITLLEHLFKSICLTVVSGEARKADTAGEISWENHGKLHWLKVKLHNVKMPHFPIKYFIRVVMIHTWCTVSERRSILARRFSPHDMEADLRHVKMFVNQKIRSGQSFAAMEINLYPFHQLPAIGVHWHSIWTVPKSLTMRAVTMMIFIQF